MYIETECLWYSNQALFRNLESDLYKIASNDMWLLFWKGQNAFSCCKRKKKKHLLTSNYSLCPLKWKKAVFKVWDCYFWRTNHSFQMLATKWFSDLNTDNHVPCVLERPNFSQLDYCTWIFSASSYSLIMYCVCKCVNIVIDVFRLKAEHWHLHHFSCF